MTFRESDRKEESLEREAVKQPVTGSQGCLHLSKTSLDSIILSSTDVLAKQAAGTPCEIHTRFRELHIFASPLNFLYRYMSAATEKLLCQSRSPDQRSHSFLFACTS